MTGKAQGGGANRTLAGEYDIKGIEIEAKFAPHVLYITNDDRPGFIGRLGTLLGKIAKLESVVQAGCVRVPLDLTPKPKGTRLVMRVG